MRETTTLESVKQWERDNPYLADSPQLNSERSESKFESGVLRADGVTKRFEAHGHEIIQPEVVYSRKAEADECKTLNQWHMLIHRFGSSIQTSKVIFKTADVRRAELEAILEKRLN